MKAVLFVSLCIGWLPQAEQDNLKKFIPAGVVLPPNFKFYHHTPAYQNGGGVHSPSYNIAANPDPAGNANREFPWLTPAGLHQATGWRSYSGVALPGPIKWFHNGDRIDWVYPTGTVFGEMLMMTDKDQSNYTFEFRTRTKSDDGKWVPRVFRPFKDYEDLVQELQAYKEPTNLRAWKQQVRAFRVDDEVFMYEIPYLPARRFLMRPFKRSDLVMTTSVNNSIVPKGYLGAVTNCVSCHSQTGLAARAILPDREWYGDVRGSDQIFSFHIFDSSCISYNGFQLPRVLNSELNLERRP